MSVPNINFMLGFVQNEDVLSGNSGLSDRYGNKRKFYSCNQDFNYVSYTETGTKEKIDYIKYSGDDEKSAGVFGPDGFMTKRELFGLKKVLRGTKSVIWHGIISFQSEFGERYVCGYEEAYRMMKTEFPRFLKAAGLNPANITWYAGLHENTRNKHIHVSFFENTPSRYRAADPEKKLYFSDGIIAKRHMRLFKIRAEMKLTDMTAEVALARREVTDLMRDLLFSERNKNKYLERVQDGMLDLVSELPDEGRLSYGSEKMAPLRPKINKIVDVLIMSNENMHKRFTGLCSKIHKHEIEQKNILTRNKVPEWAWGNFLVADKYLEDIYRRLGNYVINSVKFFKKKERATKNKYVRKRQRKQTVTAVLARCAQMSADAEEEALEIFREYLEKLEKGRENEGEQEIEME